MWKPARAERSTAASLIACLVLSGLLTAPGEVRASYAVPTAQLRSGTQVNLDNGRILTGPNAGQQLSKPQLEYLRAQRNIRADQSTGHKVSR